MIRTAKAHWTGDGPTGQGSLTTQSGVLKDQPLTFKLRFENADGTAGTNPEELVAAAHSGCFSMALAFALGQAGFTATSIDTEALVDLQPQAAGGFAIAAITLKLKASIPGISQEQFEAVAAGAKANCPISKALSAVPITLEAVLA
jgi:lipoyl-dependent peroxiredoxin